MIGHGRLRTRYIKWLILGINCVWLMIYLQHFSQDVTRTLIPRLTACVEKDQPFHFRNCFFLGIDNTRKIIRLFVRDPLHDFQVIMKIDFEKDDGREADDDAEEE